jgi:sugar phosphate isomerase/epimerase
MTLDEVAAIATRIHAAKLTVPTFVSPVLKWPAPGKGSKGGEVDFVFDPADCPAADPLKHAFDIALLLGATRLRIFSFLAYDGFAPADLREPLAALCDLADEYGVDQQLENEPVCNAATIADLAEIMRVFDHRHIRPLIDICNDYAQDKPPSLDLLAELAPRVDHISLKDRSAALRKTVPIGQGDIDFAKLLPVLLNGTRSREVLASIETHVPSDPRNATRRNVHALRHLAEHIGAEIV